MARTHEEMMANLPPERRARIKARAAEQLREIVGLKALRKLAQRSQEQIARRTPFLSSLVLLAVIDMWVELDR
jgi:hypothetical protein